MERMPSSTAWLKLSLLGLTRKTNRHYLRQACWKQQGWRLGTYQEPITLQSQQHGKAVSRALHTQYLVSLPMKTAAPWLMSMASLFMMSPSTVRRASCSALATCMAYSSQDGVTISPMGSTSLMPLSSCRRIELNLTPREGCVNLAHHIGLCYWRQWPLRMGTCSGEKNIGKRSYKITF